MSTAPLTAAAIARFGVDYVRNSTPAERAEIAARFSGDSDAQLRAMEADVESVKREIAKLTASMPAGKPKPRAAKPKSNAATSPEQRDIYYKPNSDYSDCPFEYGTDKYFDWCAARSNGSHRIKY